MSFLVICAANLAVFRIGEKAVWNHTCQQPPSNRSVSWTQQWTVTTYRKWSTPSKHSLDACICVHFTSTGVKMTVLNVFYENRKHKNSAWLIASLRASEKAHWVKMLDAMPDDLTSPQDAYGEEKSPQLALCPPHVCRGTSAHVYIHTLNKWKAFTVT